jgi:hypothetical protein
MPRTAAPALLRQALALLVPVFGLAGIPVLCAGVRLEKPGPRHGDLEGAVRVFFQDLAWHVVGPLLDIDRLLRLDRCREGDQQRRRSHDCGEPLQQHEHSPVLRITAAAGGGR